MIKKTGKIIKKREKFKKKSIEQVPEIKKDASRIEAEKVRALEPSRREKAESFWGSEAIAPHR